MGEHAKNSTFCTVNVSFQFVRPGTFSQFVAVAEVRNVLFKKVSKLKLQQAGFRLTLDWEGVP